MPFGLYPGQQDVTLQMQVEEKASVDGGSHKHVLLVCRETIEES